MGIVQRHDVALVLIVIWRIALLALVAWEVVRWWRG